ncbi:unnamed protein product [Prorocentrum cordatum]|uniref:RRM domain-containing protein n=1 Tax=Prorocentrum cordatum TaxID=2364126 RepID=A0ABN9RQ36_9DINO|nr:unnamed protein product [Polarella glacialis]
MSVGATTVCIQGFPADASTRELKNLCRFMGGFVHAHVAFAAAGPGALPSALFCKFEAPEAAVAAIEVVGGQPYDVDAPGNVLKAEFARRELEVRPGSRLPAPVGAAGRPVARPAPRAPHAAPHAATHAAAAGIGRVGSTGGELVTLAVLGLTDRGRRPEEVQDWFRGLPGFVTLQPNERLGGFFVKFDSQPAAERALQEANSLQYGAEWARRNLDDDRGVAVPQVTVAPIVHGPPAMVPVGTAQRRYTASGEELMTLAVLGLRDRGLDVDEVQQWFLNRPGYVNLQWNDRIGGIFVRFSSFVDADRALHDAGARGYGAEWARRNLDDDRGAATAWPPARFPAQPQAYGAQQAHRTLQAHGAPQAYGAPSFHGAAPYQQGGPPPKRPRGIVGELATIAVLGFNVKQGSFPDSLQDYLE